MLQQNWMQSFPACVLIIWWALGRQAHGFNVFFSKRRLLRRSFFPPLHWFPKCFLRDDNTACVQYCFFALWMCVFLSLCAGVCILYISIAAFLLYGRRHDWAEFLIKMYQCAPSGSGFVFLCIPLRASERAARSFAAGARAHCHTHQRDGLN